MSSRTIARTAVLTLALSTAALTLPLAEAAPPRQDRGRTGTAIQPGTSPRMFFQSLKDIFVLVSSLGDPPVRDVDPPEGSGICPNGRPPGHRPGRN